MPCFHPLRGIQRVAGAPVFFTRDLVRVGWRVLKVPCGQCVGCRLERSRQWAVRCMHEASLFDSNSFLTLTYDNEHLPYSGSVIPTLVPKHLSDFWKRLRFHVGSFRYFACGEYGDTFGRPHYHACVFGFSPIDAVYYCKASDGSKLFTSDLLNRVWGLGNVVFGDVTFQSAGYVARYSLKKINDNSPVREIIDVSSGEVVSREHEFVRMSLRPGIGAKWFSKYSSEVFPLDRVVVNGEECKPPKYYDRIYDLSDVGRMVSIRRRRAVDADLKFEENFPDRLRVREKVVLAQVGFLKRSLKEV